MKTKTIKAILRRKVEAWLATFADEALRKQVGDNVIVTGGAIASMLLGEKVNDIDVYFRNYDTAYKVARHYLDRFLKEHGTPKSSVGEVRMFLADENGAELEGPAAVPGRIKIVIKSAGIASEESNAETTGDYGYFEGRAPEEAGDYASEVMDDLTTSQAVDKLSDVKDAIAENGTVDQGKSKSKYRPVFLSSNAITLADQVQLIIRFYGEPDEIHANYDFVHCTNYYDYGNKTLVLRPDAMEALLTRELRYIGSRYPVCSVIRMRKFIQRDWTINAGQVLKMAIQISQLDLSDPKVLEDQLTGVDVAYFQQVLAAVNNKNPEQIDFAYLGRGD